jgi:hypothetical protein
VTAAGLAAAVAAFAFSLVGFGDEGSAPVEPAAPRAVAPKPFVPSAGVRSATVWAVGDGADGNPASIAFGNFIADRAPTRFLYLGDVYEDGTRLEFDTKYHPAYGRMVRITAPTPGNHEWGLRNEGYRPYWRDQKGVPTVPNYYAFSVARWRILSLNSEAPHRWGSRQLGWLRGQLRGPGNCRIAFVHKPRWSAGAHGNQPHMRAIWRLLRGDARLLLSGHDHNSQRFGMRAGLIQLIAGGGGATRYGVDESRDGLVWSNEDALAALRLRLSPRLARFAFVAADGRVLNRGQVRCSRR